MTKLTEAEVSQIARLARIAVPAEALAHTTEQVGQVLHLVDRMQAVNTDGVAPTSQVTGLTDVLREDEVRPSDVSPHELLASAPRHEDGYIVVKRVIQ